MGHLKRHPEFYRIELDGFPRPWEWLRLGIRRIHHVVESMMRISTAPFKLFNAGAHTSLLDHGRSATNRCLACSVGPVSREISSIASETSHSAPGQLAGYYFQAERALFHLATGKRGTVVGIETLDDVTAIDRHGQTTLEQDKHYTSNRTPLGARSKEFWNTLNNWLNAIETEEIALEKTEFHFVTNKTVNAGLVHDLIQLQMGSDEARITKFIAKLRKAGASPPKQLKTIVEGVLGRSDETLRELVQRIRVTDAGQASCGEALRETITDAMLLDTKSAPDVLNGLLGWLHDTTLLLIRSGKPAWFTRGDFAERYQRELFAHADKTFFKERAAAEIPVTEEDRATYRERLFLKQLLWLGIPENDEQFMEAMNDVYRSTAEAIRLTQKGTVTLKDFHAFDDRLVEKWKSLRRVHAPKPLPPSEDGLQGVGSTMLHRAMDHREPLAGQPTQEGYLTRGAFHKLADEPRLGWHPHYQKKWELFIKEEADRDADHRS
jgi:Holliday junction resolvasome RuvABC endonuclease subunit